ncbi:MAG: hypothetical protein LUB59_00565 [Candidatus Gastranaerophilales bacterium]|nr:hypothetical protein [Candidatus Gastranaerophilales bacterium]
MKNLHKILSVLIIFTAFAQSCSAFSFSSLSNSYADSARNYAKYYPQNTSYVNRYAKQKKSYIYSSQQAKYYGYRAPEQTTNNPYYNPYAGGGNKF